MGGNIVLKLAGEWGTQAPPQFRAVATVCPAIDLATSSDTLHHFSNRLYEKYFLWALNRRMLQKARLFPGHFDVSRLRGIRSLREFDDKITAYYCGFTGVADYYDRASAAHGSNGLQCQHWYCMQRMTRSLLSPRKREARLPRTQTSRFSKLRTAGTVHF